MRWNAVQEGSLSKTYTIRWSPASIPISTKTGISGTSTTITGLSSNTACNFTLSALNEEGSGQASNPIVMLTSKCYIEKKF